MGRSAVDSVFPMRAQSAVGRPAFDEMEAAMQRIQRWYTPVVDTLI